MLPWDEYLNHDNMWFLKWRKVFLQCSELIGLAEYKCFQMTV